MKNVLIVSSHFPPLNSMAAKRYGYMSKYMEENGYIPYILTQRARGGSYLNSKLDLECHIPKERIIRVGDIGITYPIEDPEINELIDEYKKNHVYSRVVEEESFGWFYKVKRELNLEKLRNIDIIIGTFPSVCNLLVAGYVAHYLQKPYVAEIRDLISDYQEGTFRNELWNEREKKLEKSVLEGAAGIVTVTKGFKDIIQARYPEKPVAIVYNGWDGSEDTLINDVIEESVSDDYLYYAGSLYAHRVNSLKLLIDTIYDSDLMVKLKIRSVGPENLEIQLKSYVNKLGMTGQVEILSSAPEKVVKEEQNRAKVNLVISSLDASDKALMSTIPGKVFELVKLQAPVLAITDKSSEISNILHESRKGRVACDKQEILNFLNYEYKEYIGMRKEVEVFSRKNQTARLCSFFDNLVEGDNVMKKSILTGITFLGGSIVGTAVSEIKLNNIISEKQKEKEKFRIMYQLMEKWMRLKQQGKNIETYFKIYGYKNIAIYGLGDIGKLLLNDLEDSSVNVLYGIDRNVSINSDIEVVSPDSELKKVDAVVVTAIAYFDEIDQMMSEKIDCPILSLEDIIYELV